MTKIFFIFFIIISKVAFSIDIDDTIKSTIENNPKVQIAYEKLKESKELIENAYNQKLPTITSTISGTYSKSDKEPNIWIFKKRGEGNYIKIYFILI